MEINRIRNYNLIKLVLDSNFLLAQFQFGVNIFAELNRILDFKYEIFVTEGIIKELEKLNSRYAKVALKIAKRFKILDSHCNDVDDALYELASGDVIICTNDKNLKERIRKKRAPVIYLRQKKYLMLEGYHSGG